MARQTRQKDAIVAALRAHGEFVSAQQLHQALEDAGEHIGLATVYRQLNALADSGEADTVRLDGQQLFRLCGTGHADGDDGHDGAEPRRHHHHLVCTSCGKTVEIDPPGEQWLRTIADRHGFTIESHTLELFGLCADCRKKQDDASDAS
ncbi:Fur family transcriptional regulator [Bifidobacterium choloepi]|uniref:Transcriptional repressor n=1 Tax=Bifidobacterium choloepi TaxID=2614131 RepID=A0A6I5MYZ6_9BIFI|nr:Fur family transcriptional regulator [Bifidobacterium choloepi]NEG69436.1 transcriptional repressor [Bifidobacterium choloepi]